MSQQHVPLEILDAAMYRAARSPCRSQRGAVVFRYVPFSVISLGHNQKPAGFGCDRSDACKATCRVEAIHAEQQALLNAGPAAYGADLLHVKIVAGQLVPSGGPSCVQCSKLALAAGIVGVWLFHDAGWRRYDANEFHRLSLAAAEASAVSPDGAQAQDVICEACGHLRRFHTEGGMCQGTAKGIECYCVLPRSTVAGEAASLSPSPTTSEPEIAICRICQMRLPVRLVTFAPGPRGGTDAVCAADCRRAGLPVDEAKRAEVIAIRKAMRPAHIVGPTTKTD